LDVGGDPRTWIERPQILGQIDCLNITAIQFDPTLYPNHNIRMIIGDGCHLPFNDFTYDIVFSNSVIEHVGEWSDQLHFASEVRRTGRKLWIQTPAFECILEPHLLAPFLHWLPMSIRRKLTRWCSLWGWIQRPSQIEVDEFLSGIHLLSKRKFATLFPDCKIITERIFFIFPKSYIAFRL
jgi:hypothetical protein